MGRNFKDTATEQATAQRQRREAIEAAAAEILGGGDETLSVIILEKPHVPTNSAAQVPASIRFLSESLSRVITRESRTGMHLKRSTTWLHFADQPRRSGTKYQKLSFRSNNLAESRQEVAVLESGTKVARPVSARTSCTFGAQVIDW